MGTTTTPSLLTDRDAKATAASPTWKKFQHAHLQAVKLPNRSQARFEQRDPTPRLPHGAGFGFSNTMPSPSVENGRRKAHSLPQSQLFQDRSEAAVGAQTVET